MANDCSERICQFNLAHVDTPKGDLDSSSGKLSGPSVTIIEDSDLYPAGTQESFPNMVDSAGTVLTNTAHYYAECSNKGICDRSTGTCGCFEGYEGSGCQRASCPVSSGGVCSSHGTCETIRTLADMDNNNVYELWDQDATMGCNCDGGFQGSDCSEKICKFGPDPLYYDDFQNIRYANFTYDFYTTASAAVSGNYSIIFTDHSGQEWQTEAISINADCDAVTDALEAIPNKVIAEDSVNCYQFAVTGNTHAKYTVSFPNNAGNITEISINKYLDGARPTLYTDETSTSTLDWHVYSNGFKGEDEDMVPDECEGITVSVLTGTAYHTLVFDATTSTADIKALKICLGDSDGDMTNNVDVYNWDHGDQASDGTSGGVFYWPHLIKLVDATGDDSDGDFDEDKDMMDPSITKNPITQLCSSTTAFLNVYSLQADGTNGWCLDKNRPGFYAVLYYDGTDFIIFSPVATDFGASTKFHVYTTTGTLNLVDSSETAATYDSGDSAAYTMTRKYSDSMYTTADLSCEGTTKKYCLNKNDVVLFINTDMTSTTLPKNPAYTNMYTVQKIYTAENSEAHPFQIVLDGGVNAGYTSGTGVSASVYKFIPPAGAAAYNYVGECSNRGICDSTLGVCTCFAGYTSDNCGTQNALAH